MQLTRELHPSMIILDLKLPDISGLEVANRCLRLEPAPKNLFKVFRVDEHRIANFFTSPLVGEVSALCAAGEGYLISHQ